MIDWEIIFLCKCVYFKDAFAWHNFGRVPVMLIAKEEEEEDCHHIPRAASGKNYTVTKSDVCEINF